MESHVEDQQTEGSARSAAHRRAEVRRRKLLQNSEERMRKIGQGISGDRDNSSADRPARGSVEPLTPYLNLDRNEAWSSSFSSKRLSPHMFEGAGSSSELSERNKCGDEADKDEVAHGVQQRPWGELSGDELSRSPRRGLHNYLSRFDDAVNQRGQLANEKVTQDSNAEVEELDLFRFFRLVGSATLAVFMRIFVCQYLSIFAPFLTLELCYMGLHKYFPKVEKKSKTTMLTTALLLSGIPAEVINRSMDTYRKISDVFSEICVYFFTFIMCHELLVLFGSEMS